MKKDNKGFSLVELIIVIAIMAVLIGLLAPQYLKFVKKSKVSADVSNGQSLATAFNVAFADSTVSNGTYSGTSATTMTSGVNAQWPETKLVTGGTWKVIVNDNGVSEVQINNAKVWPTVSGSWASN